jgi:hypothetical protein
MQFPATAAGDSSSVSVVARNTSAAAAHMFEFGVPHGSHLQVTPRVALLPAGGSVRVQLEFSPPAADTRAAAGAGAAAAPTAPAAGEAAAGDAAPGADPQRQEQEQQQVTGTLDDAGACCREWLLPCYVRQAGASAAPGSSHGADCVLHLSVATCAVAPELHASAPAGLTQPPGGACPVLDFGALPVGERGTRELLLHNSGAAEQHTRAPAEQTGMHCMRLAPHHGHVGQSLPDSCHWPTCHVRTAGPDVASLRAQPLDPTAGAFSIVNALRPLPPGGSARVLLAFTPQHCCEYQETLCLRCASTRTRPSLLQTAAYACTRQPRVLGSRVWLRLTGLSATAHAATLALPQVLQVQGARGAVGPGHHAHARSQPAGGRVRGRRPGLQGRAAVRPAAQGAHRGTHKHERVRHRVQHALHRRPATSWRHNQSSSSSASSSTASSSRSRSSSSWQGDCGQRRPCRRLA